ncbi:32931_t:CDS:2, partial [Racocetra persica]
PVETYVTIEQFFLNLAEKHILSDNLALVKKIEVRCGSSKVSVNHNVDLEYNLWKIAIEYRKHFVFRLLMSQITSPIYQHTNPFDIIFNTQNSSTLSKWKLSIKPNKKEQLWNDIITWIKKKNSSWIGPNVAETIRKPFIQDLTNTLWYIDGYNHNTFTQRYNLPKVFESFIGYNNPQDYKYACSRFNSKELNEYSDCLLKYITRLWISRLPFSRFFKELVMKLDEDLSKYTKYLIYKRAETPQNQELDYPIVNEYNNSQLEILLTNVKCTSDNIIKYKNLSLALQEKKYWQPILVNNFCSSISRENFSVFESATEQDMESLWELVLEVDDLLVPEDTSKKHIKNKSHILEFMSHCCHSRTYFFEIRKYQEAETANEDHYMLFYEIYGKDTTEKYYPSLLQKANASKLSSTFTTTNSFGINGMGFSPQVLYSQYRLNPEEKNFLKTFIETIDYTCSTTFYRISDLAKANSSLVLNDDNCNTENNLIKFQDVSNSMHEDDDSNIKDVEDYDET